jgi:cobalt-zinc-cadmium efflux system membrane fusion protein
MIKKYISLLLVFSFLVLGITCKRTGEQNADTRISQKEAESSESLDKPEGKGRRIGQPSKAVGRGYGKKALGKRAGRAWGEIDVIELSDEEKEAIEIETVTASYKPLRSQLQAMGKVLAHPLRKAIVSYAFSARISEIHVRIGDWVKAGQKLVTLQSEEVGTAKSEFYKAMADYELAKVNFEREKRLSDRGVGARKNFLASEAGLKVAEANLNAAEKKLHVLGFTEEQVKTISETHQINPIITLFAPIGGKVIENRAILGAMVDQETEILTILDPTVLCIDAEIYEQDIAKIQIGQEVEVSVPAYPGETFVGKIRYISDVLNEETRTITVRTEVENRGYKLKPGMFADIKIILDNQSKALVLPREAILDDKEYKIVFLEINEKYFPKVVEIGAKENDLVEILSGVKEGDKVVTKGNYQLKSKLYDEILKKAGIH